MMDAFKCKLCGVLVTDPAKHVCSAQFKKVDMPAADICKVNGHSFKFNNWTDSWSGPGTQVDTWENDEGHFEPYNYRDMETKTCSVCGHEETRCLREYPNPHLKS